MVSFLDILISRSRWKSAIVGRDGRWVQRRFPCALKRIATRVGGTCDGRMGSRRQVGPEPRASFSDDLAEARDRRVSRSRPSAARFGLLLPTNCFLLFILQYMAANTTKAEAQMTASMRKDLRLAQCTRLQRSDFPGTELDETGMFRRSPRAYDLTPAAAADEQQLGAANGCLLGPCYSRRVREACDSTGSMDHRVRTRQGRRCVDRRGRGVRCSA